MTWIRITIQLTQNCGGDSSDNCNLSQKFEDSQQAKLSNPKPKFLLNKRPSKAFAWLKLQFLLIFFCFRFFASFKAASTKTRFLAGLAIYASYTLRGRGARHDRMSVRFLVQASKKGDSDNFSGRWLSDEQTRTSDSVFLTKGSWFSTGFYCGFCLSTIFTNHCNFCKWPVWFGWFKIWGGPLAKRDRLTIWKESNKARRVT